MVLENLKVHDIRHYKAKTDVAEGKHDDIHSQVDGFGVMEGCTLS